MKIVKLSDVADLTVGFVGTMAKHYVDHGVPFIRSMNVEPFKIKYNDLKYIAPEFNEKLAKSKLHQGDVVIVRTGKPGACAVIPDDYEEINCSDLVIVRPHKNELDSLYLACYINYSYRTVNSQLVGAVQQHFNVRVAEKLDIRLPSLSEQKRIGQIIGALNEKISTNEAINENLYQQVAAIYGSLFGKANQQVTSVGQYSEQIYSGGTPSTSKSEYWDGNYHWFSSGETRNRFAITTDKTITKTGIDNSSTKLAHKYDIVMASAGQGFTRGQTTMLLLDTYVNQSVIVIHANRTVLPYLFWNLASRYEELRAISDSSSIRGSLTTKMIAGFEIPEVDSETLVAFSDFA